MEQQNGKIYSVLLIEDNPGDIRLIQEALRNSEIVEKIDVVVDGDEAMNFLRKKGDFAEAKQPDLILLDLNLPKRNGLEVLEELKSNDKFKHIPVVVLTSSEADQDVFKSYELHANCYIAKPIDFEQFSSVLTSIEKFWFIVAKLPTE